MNLFIYKLSLRLFLRNKVINVFIIWCLSVFFISTSYSVSISQQQFMNINKQFPEGQTRYEFIYNPPIDYSNVINLQKKWNNVNGYKGSFVLSFFQFIVDSDLGAISAYIYGVDSTKNAIITLQNGITLNDQGCIVTSDVFLKLFAQKTWDPNQTYIIRTQGLSLSVKAVVSASYDAIYVTYSNALRLMPDIKVTQIQVALDKNTPINNISTGNENINPQISELTKSSSYRIWLNNVGSYLILATLVLLLSLTSIIQLYNFKMIQDETRWRILRTLGAETRHLRMVIIFDLCLLSMLSISLTFIFFYLLKWSFSVEVVLSSWVYLGLLSGGVVFVGLATMAISHKLKGTKRGML